MTNSKIAKIIKLSYINCKISMNIRTLFRITVAHQVIEMSGNTDNICHVVFS